MTGFLRCINYSPPVLFSTLGVRESRKFCQLIHLACRAKTSSLVEHQEPWHMWAAVTICLACFHLGLFHWGTFSGATFHLGHFHLPPPLLGLHHLGYFHRGHFLLGLHLIGPPCSRIVLHLGPLNLGLFAWATLIGPTFTTQNYES